MHQHKVSKITLKSEKKDYIQQPLITIATLEQTEKNLENRNGKENNCMDISSDKVLRFTREDLDIAKKGKSRQRNWTFFNNSTKQLQKD